jgi:hypothetical protein
MSKRLQKLEKKFTVEEANATLPLVRAITRDLVELSQEVAERELRLAELVGGRKLRAGDPYADELLESTKGIEKDMARLQGFVDELRELGVEPKSALDGLIDFPSRLDGRQVYLCWKLGEPELMYYHERDAGFAGRKPLPAAVAARVRNGELEPSCL